MVSAADLPTHLQRHRAESFGSVAAEYDRQRPSYPEALIDDLVALDPPAVRDVLDVGCGTGKAARLLAARGVTVLGVEIDSDMAAVARSHGIEVEVGSFETWEDAGRRFDLITCGQAWHWIDPEIGLTKAVAVLRPGGWLAPFWNYATFDAPVRAAVDEVYLRHTPDLVRSVTHSGGRELDWGAWRSDPRLASVEQRTYEWEHVYSTDDWLALSQTHSDHVMLEPAVRAAMIEDMRAAIDGLGGQMTAHYTTFATVAKVA